ncbi:glutaredoxin family protein [Desulforhopalus vacuolatus]|uniref:glutaredoxin family protein n=1 Tax=Desulforhopalus vacuolatus TaxID=40414 RepID=UPI0019628551|nr:glutaredoxin family protein [Desulforhopalus vacuolatus]MBM9520954.1 glutaredoxin family protein [Desulforhopalus vacuolatus]
MKIILYKSALCPRCHVVQTMLEEITMEHPDLQVEEVDILTSPLRALRAGVHIIPTLDTGTARLSMIVPTREKVRTFLQANGL